MIQLTKTGLAGTVDLAELEHQFERLHVFRLTGLLEPDLLQLASSLLESCTWTEKGHGKISREAVPDNRAPVDLLNSSANTPAFLDLIRRITGWDRLTWFNGRVYRMDPAADHFDSWHADIGDSRHDRLVGMSINLGASSYEGGVFRLRDEATGTILCELPNIVKGDAIFFRISTALKHMVTPVEGNQPKTAFAGWFESGEGDFHASPRPDVPPSGDPGAL
jgi:hypothetical protein